MTNSNIQQFGCRNCGHTYKIFPPDSRYQVTYMKSCDEENDPSHNYEQGYECENCNVKTFLYWCDGNHFAAVSKNFDMGLNERKEYGF